MNAVTAVRQNIQWGNEILEMVMADVTIETATWAPPGQANPIGALYAHALIGEDGVINGLLQGQPPRFATAGDRIGVPAPQMHLDFAWGRSLRPDLPALRAYRDTVMADVDAYFATLTEAGLDRELDLSADGLGVRSVAWVLNALVAGHLNNMAGEISALKGALGLKGYPF